ncbi:MAG: Uma2 family endonuclease [Bacteroidota bacterium]
MEVERDRHKISVKDYQKMIEVGILTEKDKVELIHGEIIEMTPISSLHSSVVNRLSNLLIKKLIEEKVIVSTQNPIRATIDSYPEPDIAVLKFKDDYYKETHPGGNDISLIIEVSHSTLMFDRNVKLPIYAKASIPEYWIIDAENEMIEVYSEPKEDIYKKRILYKSGENIPLANFGVSLKVSEIF